VVNSLKSPTSCPWCLFVVNYQSLIPTHTSLPPYPIILHPKSLNLRPSI